jgi:hypothetical protein
VRDSRGLEDPSAGAEGERIQGNLETRPEAKLEDAGLGDARGLVARRHWRREDSGRPEDSPSGSLKDAKFEETRSSIAGQVGRCRMQGNLFPHRKTDGTMNGPINLWHVARKMLMMTMKMRVRRRLEKLLSALI